jgi:hypothetical protein
LRDFEAFVYCWTDTLTNKLYIGWHKGSVDDGYICSSKLMLEQYQERPHYFIRSIIGKGSAKDCKRFETVLLQSVNAKKDKQFYNQSNNTNGFVCKGHTKETRMKMAAANNSKGKNHPLFGKKYSQEEKQKMREACLGINKSDSMRSKLSAYCKNAMWITNGSSCKRILKGSPIPEGWILGKKINKGF